MKGYVHKAALRLCTMTALLNVIWCVVHYGSQNALELSPQNAALDALRILWVLLQLSTTVLSVAVQEMQVSMPHT